MLKHALVLFPRGPEPVSRWHLFFYAGCHPALASTWFLSPILGPGNTFLESGWIICRWQSSAKHCLESLKETTCPECASDQSDCDCTSHPWDLFYVQCTLCIPDTCYRRHRWCPFLPGMLAPPRGKTGCSALQKVGLAPPRKIDEIRRAQRGKTDCRFHWYPFSLRLQIMP